MSLGTLQKPKPNKQWQEKLEQDQAQWGDPPPELSNLLKMTIVEIIWNMGGKSVLCFDSEHKEGVKNCPEVTNSNPHYFRPLKLSVLHTGNYCAVWLISQFL